MCKKCDNQIQNVRTSSAFNKYSVNDIGDYAQWNNGSSKDSDKYVMRNGVMVNLADHNQRVRNENNLNG